MKDLTKGNIYKTFILFAIPLVLSGLLSQAYAIIDSVIAGKFLGADGIAATGATGALIQFVSSVFWGYTAGFSIYVAVLFGAKEYDRLKNTIYSNFLIFTFGAMLASAIMIFFKEGIFDFLKVDNTIRKDASTYFVTYISGLFSILLTNFGALCLNAMGMSGYPFKMAIVSSVLNIGGNIISVTLLKMGVFGIALSSVIAATVVDVCYVIKMRQCFREMRSEKNFKMHFSLGTIKKTVSYAIPSTFQQFVMYAASFVISPMINRLGSGMTAAFAVSNRIYEINAGVYQNSSKTLSNYTAQCVGAKKYNLINKGIGVGFLQGALLVMPFVLGCAIFAKPLCMAFFPSEYAGEGLEYSVVFAKWYLPFILFNVVNNLFHAFYRGIKNMKMLLITTCFGSVVRAVATAILSVEYGIHGVYAGWVISWILEAILCTVTFLWNQTKKTIIAK